MAVPVPHVLAAGALDGLLLLGVAVLGFVLVAVVAAVVLALIHAVLPSEDSGAEAVHRAEQEQAGRAAQPAAAADESSEPGAAADEPAEAAEPPAASVG